VVSGAAGAASGGSVTGGSSAAVPRLAILGDGRMGRAIDALARERGFEVEALLGRDALVGDPARVRAALDRCDVAIEVTAPAAAVDHAFLCLDAGCPVVVGTTGWYDRLPEVEGRVAETGGALLWAANFSLGVTLMKALCMRAGALIGRTKGFEAALLETHHAGKRDAPSGTALVLARETAAGLGAEVPITSVRLGHAPGTHELVLDGAFEQLVVRHVARDRRVFADGALHAAVWLRGRVGLWTMDDVFEMEGA